jgi:Helix-turn-helix.
MEDIAKKFLQKDSKDPLHIGNLVHWEIKQNNLRKKDVAERLGIGPTTLNQYFKQSSLQTTILWRLSRAINFNFLMYLGQKLDVDFVTEKEKELQEQLRQKEEEILSLKTQIGVYKQIHKID